MTDIPKSHPGNPAATPADDAVSFSHWLAPAGGPRGISRDLARQIIVGYTAPGDCVIDVGEDLELGDACVRSGRRYHALQGVQHLAGIGHAAGYIDLLYLSWPAAVDNDQWLIVACGALLRGTGQLICAIGNVGTRDPADGPSGPDMSHQVAAIAESARLARLRVRELIDVRSSGDDLPRQTPPLAAARLPHTELLILGY